MQHMCEDARRRGSAAGLLVEHLPQKALVRAVMLQYCQHSPCESNECTPVSCSVTCLANDVDCCSHLRVGLLPDMSSSHAKELPISRPYISQRHSTSEHNMVHAENLGLTGCRQQCSS